MAPKSKKNVRPSRLSIEDWKFTKSKGENDEVVLRRILTDLKTFDFYGRYDLVRELAVHTNLPKSLNPVYGVDRSFHGIINLDNWISKEGYPFWLMGLFFRNIESLRKFIKYRDEISADILKGDGISALKNIASLSQISESWWSIEIAIHVNKELLGNDTKAYIKQLSELHPKLNISGITHDLLLLSEGSTAQLYIHNILGRLKEYKSSSVKGAMLHRDLESCMLLPLHYDRERKPAIEAFNQLRTWSIFDQYMVFRSIFMEKIANDDVSVEWLQEVKTIAQMVGDWEFCNVIEHDKGEDEFISNVIELYTGGNYHTVLSEVANALDNRSKKVIGLLEIYARSKIYTSTIGSGDTYFDRLADELAKVLNLDSKSIERLGHLAKISVKFRTEAWAKSLSFHLISTQEWRHDMASVEAARKQTFSLGSYNTPKAKDRYFHLHDIVLDSGIDIPRHRTLRYSNDLGEDLIMDSSIFPIYSDYLKTQSRLFLDKNLIAEAIDFSISEYLKNSVSYDYLPVLKLSNLITEMQHDDGFDYISSLIILDIYGRERDRFFDEKKSEIFEEYIDSCSEYQPSKIFSAEVIDSKINYFLRNLCVPSQLDNIIQFSSNDEVIHERVAIIDLLISARAGNIEELRIEKDKVLETLFSEKLRAKIETGKLYVDVQALETHRKHVYVALYDQAKSLEGGLNLEPLLEDGSNIDSSDLVQIDNNASSSLALALASSKKSNILLRIFRQAVQDFAMNENYGLDKYLSAEVRHVVFINQLRSCFEKNELVTVQKNGQYLPNEFLAQKYNYLSYELIENLDIILSNFSKVVDDILEDTNERFRIKDTDMESSNIFDFCAYHSRIVRTSQIINSSANFDGFFKSLIGFMWELAIESARSAQEIINDFTLAKILAAIDDLENSVTDLKGNLAMVDLIQSIKNTRSDFKKEIELVLNWFRFVGSEDVQTYERLSVVVEAAVSSFQSIFKHKGKNLNFIQERSELLLSYSEAKSLFISLFTALENALRYGASGTPVEISHHLEFGVEKIKISNNLGKEIISPVEFIAEVKSKWTTAFSKLSTAEGGSGIYKIYNLLNNASPGFGFDISIDNGKFLAIMKLKNEYFNNRG